MTQYRLPQAARTTARRKVVSMAVLAALAGCSTPDGGRRADAPQTGLDGLPPLAMTLAPTAQARATPAPEAARAQPLRTAQASRAVGGDKRAAPLSAQADAGQKTSDTPAANVPPGKPAAAAQEGVLLNFVDADIPAVLRVLAKFTGKQFLVDPRVKGTLTLVSQGPVAPDAAYGMLLGALRMQGYAAVDVAGGTRVMPEADAKLQGGPVQSADAPAGGGVVTRTFRLSYENATALVPVLRPMIAPSNSITAYPANNTLVITDYADNLDRIGRIIASIDNPSSLVTEVVKVRQGIAVDIAGMASELLEAQRNEDPSQRVVVVADPRANSVIVRSGSPGRAKLARDLIRQLDSSQTDPDNLHVVYLRNAQATHLARVLRGVLTGESDGGGAGGDAAARAALGPGGAFGGGLGNSSGNANGQQANTSGASASGAGQNNGTGAGARSGYNGRGTDALGPGTTGRKGQDGSAFSANGVTVNADATTNTLIISAPEPMYRSLRKVIDLLDQRRAQVLVESLIVEITENDGAELGIQWLAGGGRVFGGANFGKDTFTPGGKNSIQALPKGGLSIGVISGTINIPGVGEVANLGVLARAMQTKGGSNVLSTPNLLTLDNEPASIMVGKTVPFVSGQYITPGSTNSNPFQTIQREDIGLKLNIRPQISEGGTVKLDIYQEVSSIDRTADVAAGLVTNKRAMDTSVLLDDGQIMVLGGLLEDSVTNSRDQVPVLGSIPVLGSLFRYDTRGRSKTNLMVFLRPYVVRDSAGGMGLTQSRYNYMRRVQSQVQPADHPLLPDMRAPVLPPAGVPVAGQPYDLRAGSLEQTLRREPPATQGTTEPRQLAAVKSPADERTEVRTRLPAGLTVASDPAALYGQPDTSNTVLQFADVATEAEATAVSRRVQVSGLKAYTLSGPGGQSYVVRASVPRDQRSVDTALQLLRELGYQPEMVLGL